MRYESTHLCTILFSRDCQACGTRLLISAYDHVFLEIVRRAGYASTNSLYDPVFPRDCQACRTRLLISVRSVS